MTSLCSWCDGDGIVPVFYLDGSNDDLEPIETIMEVCVVCHGKGFISTSE